MEDEFTDEMHATFWVDEETDKKHRVWAAIREERGGYFPLEQALMFLDLTMADYKKYYRTYPEEFAD